MTTKINNDDTVRGLSSRQIDCARLIATSPGRSKQDIASSLKISRRTVFRWLANEAFQRQVEEFRRSRIVASDAKSIYGMISPKDRKELLTLLLDEKENRHLHLLEIVELENKVMEIAKNDDDPLREETIKAVEKVERLLGRLRRNALFSMDYEQDGSPVKQTKREAISDLQELILLISEFGDDDPPDKKLDDDDLNDDMEELDDDLDNKIEAWEEDESESG